MGLEGLRKAAKIGGIRGEAAVDQALKQVLQRHAGTHSGSGGEVSQDWWLAISARLHSFVPFLCGGITVDLDTTRSCVEVRTHAK